MILNYIRHFQSPSEAFGDVRYVVPFITQFWLSSTPIGYPSSLLHQPWRTIYGLVHSVKPLPTSDRSTGSDGTADDKQRSGVGPRYQPLRCQKTPLQSISLILSLV